MCIRDRPVAMLTALSGVSQINSPKPDGSLLRGELMLLDKTYYGTIDQISNVSPGEFSGCLLYTSTNNYDNTSQINNQLSATLTADINITDYLKFSAQSSLTWGNIGRSSYGSIYNPNKSSINGEDVYKRQPLNRAPPCRDGAAVFRGLSRSRRNEPVCRSTRLCRNMEELPEATR